MNKVTQPTKTAEIKREKHTVDIKGKILGRVATDIAKLLMGKAKPYFVRNQDCGDFVTVINAKHVILTGKKESDKKYYRYSGYPGGLRIETAGQIRARKPQGLIEHAVKGMLPQNKLRDRMMKRLTIYSEEQPAQKEGSNK
ncbi:MAG: 50S ribosomal protein L13 [Candidatus Levybacteria bacterium]|nr:50S ribosomal protein L13 [Candidatus Levybacteria bacterium]